MNKIAVGISAAVIAAGVSLGAVSLANAQTPSPEPSPSAGATQDGSERPDRDHGGRHGGDREGHGPRGDRGGRGGMKGADTAAVAEKLGVDEDALTEAFKAAREATRAERDQLTDEEKADMTKEQRQALHEEREAAFRKALASELGVDESKVTAVFDEIQAEQAAERSAHAKEVLDQAVTDGTLTQAEADAVNKAIEAGIVDLGGPKGRGR